MQLTAIVPPNTEKLDYRLRVGSAAAYTGLSASTLNKMRLTGLGPTFLKLNRRVVYERSALDAWLATKRRSSTSDTGASQ